MSKIHAPIHLQIYEREGTKWFFHGGDVFYNPAMPSARYANAARIKPFGARVWGGPRRPEPLTNFDKIVVGNEWHALLPEVDYLVVATPLTPETKALIDETVLRWRSPPKASYPVMLI